MKHGSVYTEDVVIGVITKMKNCIQEMLADGHKVKLDGIGTLCRQRQGLQRHGERHPHRHRLPGRPEPQVHVQGTLYA